MPGPLIPLIIGAGARILGGQAARAAAGQAARTTATQGARAAAKKTAKSTAKKTTRSRNAKKASAKKTAAKKTASKKATASTRTPGMRTARTPKWAQTWGSKKPSEVAIRISAKDKQQTARVQSMLRQRKTSRSKRMSALKAQAGVTGASAVAYEGVRLGMSKKPAPPKTSTPIRVKRRNAATGYEVNYDPNRKKK